jgi:hypothetical protein
MLWRGDDQAIVAVVFGSLERDSNQLIKYLLINCLKTIKKSAHRIAHQVVLAANLK